MYNFENIKYLQINYNVENIETYEFWYNDKTSLHLCHVPCLVEIHGWEELWVWYPQFLVGSF